MANTAYSGIRGTLDESFLNKLNLYLHDLWYTPVTVPIGAHEQDVPDNDCGVSSMSHFYSIEQRADELPNGFRFYAGWRALREPARQSLAKCRTTCCDLIRNEVLCKEILRKQYVFENVVDKTTSMFIMLFDTHWAFVHLSHMDFMKTAESLQLLVRKGQYPSRISPAAAHGFLGKLLRKYLTPSDDQHWICVLSPGTRRFNNIRFNEAEIESFMFAVGESPIIGTLGALSANTNPATATTTSSQRCICGLLIRNVHHISDNVQSFNR